MVWYGLVLFGIVWYCLVLFGMVWYGLVWFGMVNVFPEGVEMGGHPFCLIQ
jgi:hypothetical protein